MGRVLPATLVVSVISVVILVEGKMLNSRWSTRFPIPWELVLVSTHTYFKRLHALKLKKCHVIPNSWVQRILRCICFFHTMKMISECLLSDVLFCKRNSFSIVSDYLCHFVVSAVWFVWSIWNTDHRPHTNWVSRIWTFITIQFSFKFFALKLIFSLFLFFL